VQRWLAATGLSALLQRFLDGQKLSEGFLANLARARARLEALYREKIGPEEMRERKKAEYAELKKTMEANPRYKDLELNNALLASFATYTQLVPEFESILKANNGNLEAFYAQVERYAASEPSNRGPLSRRNR